MTITLSRPDVNPVRRRLVGERRPIPGPPASSSDTLDDVGAALVWFVVAVVLGAAEALTGELFLLSLAVGALAGAGSAAVGLPVWVDVLVFALVSVGLVVGVRPPLLRRMRESPGITTGVEALRGRSALVIQPITEHAGRIRLDGSDWNARCLDSTDAIEAGTTVRVAEITGATAVVYREL